MEAEELQAEIEAGQDVSELTVAKPTGEATLRDRYRAVVQFRKVDRIPNFEFGYWAETLNNWHAEGLPPEVTDQKSAYEYFGIEDWRRSPNNPSGLAPAFEQIVLEEDDDYQIYQGQSGETARINKRGNKSIPQHIDFKLKGRKEWEEEFKPRLQPGPERVPDNWSELVEAYNRRDYPLCCMIGSLIGQVRNWMGFERVALMVYEDPELMEEIVEHLCQMALDNLDRILPDVEFDFGAGWEDICYNHGPIVGVPFMRDVVKPRYKRIMDKLRRHGVDIAWVDCDGDITPVLDCFFGGEGLNGAFPVEVHAGSDPVDIRRRYPDSVMQGGFDKMKLLKGPEAILAELKRLEPVVKEGGFIPGVDHRVQADVSLANYKYYLKMKRELYGAGGEPQYDESEIG